MFTGIQKHDCNRKDQKNSIIAWKQINNQSISTNKPIEQLRIIMMYFKCLCTTVEKSAINQHTLSY